jgi:hypothetical protein
MGSADLASEAVWSALRRPELVTQAVRGQAVAAPVFGK